MIVINNIKYRPIEKRDYDAVGEIINRAFSLHTYVGDRKTLEAFKMQYVHGCLSEAQYTCVAEKNGKVVGVIMGRADGDYCFFSHLKYIAQALKYSIKMYIYSRNCKSGIEDYNNLLKIYRSFSKKHMGEFDGVLTLFAVSEDCRGLGIGKTLLDNLFKYFKSKSVKKIYLYTDNTCNYGFYEHMGFIRFEERELEITKNERPFTLDVFLYGRRTDD